MIYLLVHGAYHGSWCWKRVKSDLESKGHEVHAIDLPGHSPGDSKKVSLKDYVQHVVNYIEIFELRNIVLVGHSFGGIVISHVVNLVPEKISKLVFISGAVLKEGSSFLEVLPEKAREKYSLISSEEIPVNLDYIKRTFFNKSSDDLLIDLCLDKMVSQPLQPYKDKSFAKNLEQLSLPVHYILGKQDIAVSDEMFSIVKRVLPKHTNYIFIDADHEAMITSSEEIARLLKAL